MNIRKNRAIILLRPLHGKNTLNLYNQLRICCKKHDIKDTKFLHQRNNHDIKSFSKIIKAAIKAQETGNKITIIIPKDTYTQAESLLTLCIAGTLYVTGMADIRTYTHNSEYKNAQISYSPELQESTLYVATKHFSNMTEFMQENKQQVDEIQQYLLKLTDFIK